MWKFVKKISNAIKEAAKPSFEHSISPAAIFTPRAQQVFALARKEADRLHERTVDTEHLLLGLLKLGQGVAVNVLKNVGVDIETVRLEIEKGVNASSNQKPDVGVASTPAVKAVLAFACEEAKALGHTYVGTEHILLGLLREGDGPGAKILKDIGVNVAQLRVEILKELDPNIGASDS